MFSQGHTLVLSCMAALCIYGLEERTWRIEKDGDTETKENQSTLGTGRERERTVSLD